MFNVFHPGDSEGKSIRSVSKKAFVPLRVTRRDSPSITNSSLADNPDTVIPKMEKLLKADKGFNVIRQGAGNSPFTFTRSWGNAHTCSFPRWMQAKVSVTRLNWSIPVGSEVLPVRTDQYSSRRPSMDKVHCWQAAIKAAVLISHSSRSLPWT